MEKLELKPEASGVFKVIQSKDAHAIRKFLEQWDAETTDITEVNERALSRKGMWYIVSFTAAAVAVVYYLDELG